MKFRSPPVSLLAVHGAICIFFATGPVRAVTTTAGTSLQTGPGPISIPSTSPSTSPYSIQTASPTTSYTGSESSSTSASSTSSAEYPSLSGVPTCVVSCFDNSIADSNCTSVVDVNCFCVSARFPQALVACIAATCPSELSTAEQLSQQFCNVASSHPTLSFPTPTTTATSASGTVTPTPSSSLSATSASATTAQRAGAAGRGKGDGATAIVLGLAVGVVGILVGALCV